MILSYNIGKKEEQQGKTCNVECKSKVNQNWRTKVWSLQGERVKFFKVKVKTLIQRLMQTLRHTLIMNSQTLTCWIWCLWLLKIQKSESIGSLENKATYQEKYQILTTRKGGGKRMKRSPKLRNWTNPTSNAITVMGWVILIWNAIRLNPSND